MKKLILLLSIIYLANLYAVRDVNEFAHANTQWTIVGAGPAGIICVGLLLDLGIPAQDITWIDPEFNVGRIGQYYTTVPANNKTKIFVTFLNSCKAFQACPDPIMQSLYEYDPEQEYELDIIVKPLTAITSYFRTHVISKQTTLTGLHFQDNLWNVSTEQETFSSSHVILATGSHPRELNYDCKEQIPLDIALDKSSLAQLVTPEDSIAVIGSAHSAILILKYLCELSVARIINFYKAPIEYHHPELSLYGITAHWAQTVLEKNPPANIVRIQNNPDSLKAWLPVCNKIIYAVGYDRNDVPPIQGVESINYDANSGIIAPRLFGLGIAFPEKHYDATVQKEVSSIGLASFMEYAQRIMPQWISSKDAFSRLASFEDLFIINTL